MTRAIRTSEPASTELTEAHPGIGSLSRHDPRTRRLLIQRFPIRVVDHLEPTEVVIVALAHLKLRPGYWRNRT